MWINHKKIILIAIPMKKSVWLTLAQTPYLDLKQSETVCLLTTSVTWPQIPPPKHIPSLPAPLHPSCDHQQTQTTSSGGRPVSSSQLAYTPFSHSVAINGYYWEKIKTIIWKCPSHHAYSGYVANIFLNLDEIDNALETNWNLWKENKTRTGQ